MTTLTSSHPTWHIKAKPVTLTLSQFCGLYDLDITVHRREDNVVALGASRYYASFDALVEIVDDGILTSPAGNGKSTRSALVDLARQISGELLQLGGWGRDSQRFTAPTIKGL